MAASQDDSPGEDYFNDLSQQLPGDREERRESQEDNDEIPKQKRIACVLCRKRKLKCDGNRPSCSTCNRLQHDCSYDEVRRKSGPKRGYVKALEARLAQVETLLKTQDDPPAARKESNANVQPAQQSGMVPEYENFAIGQDNQNMLPHMERTVNRHDGPRQAPFPHAALGSAGNGSSEEPFPWEMIGLGLDEPLPTQDVVNELNHAYFDKIHPSVPMIHRPRYFAAMNLAPHMRPPVCLRYAMWCNAAAVTDKYEGLQEHFYNRARKYMQQDEMKGHGESMITVAHCQTWVLIATYEFKSMFFPRAWMSSGRGSRMSQMMGLHRLDGAGLDVKQCLPPPKDWTDREERRRTFWMAFCVDRYSSIGTGWPMTFEEKDVLTLLPAEESAFELSKPGKTMKLSEALEPDGTPKLSSFGGVILMSTMFGRNLTHLHRPEPEDRDDDLNGEFWKRHRSMDNILLSIALTLPDLLRLPSGLNDPNIVFMNMNIHTSTICLHQAAIFKADKNRMPARISAESKVRCITAAAEIASIMRQISHMDLSAMNPFISFCLYVAARVFVQYLKSRPKDTQVRASLQFLLSAMHAIKRKNPLTESFLVQLDVDLESAGLEDARQFRQSMPQTQSAVANRSEGCPMTEFLGMEPIQNPRSTYGDNGLSKYNDPRTAPELVPSMPNANGLDYSTAEMADYISGTTPFELPNRHRTPGSTRGSNSHKSPNSNGNQDMDTSPDGSNNDLQTPNSSTMSHQNHSSGTSNTAYSPSNQQQAQHQQHQQHQGLPTSGNGYSDLANEQLPNAFMFNVNSFTAAADHSLGSGFVMPEDWNGSGTGFTPGPATGMTPGASTGMTPGTMNDMLNSMTDADWNQMLEGFGSGSTWDAGVAHDAGMIDFSNPTRR